MANTIKYLDTQCELRLVVDNIEQIIEPQIFNDLVSTQIKLGDQLSDSVLIEDNLELILQYSIPSVLGFAVLVSLLICGTIFCVHPQKLRNLCKCGSTPIEISVPSERGSLTHSPRPSPLHTPAPSVPASRAVSPARFPNPQLDFSHSYRS
jgi:hypothetical protein